MSGHKTAVSPKVMALIQKERNAIKYKKIKLAGLCPVCSSPMDRDGYYCSECLEKSRKYKKENREFFLENHLCTQCGKEKVPARERICPECRAKISLKRKPITEEQKKRYNKRFRKQQKILYGNRSNMGICTRCGKREAAPGKKKCAICLEKDAELHRQKRSNVPNIREYRKENHLCYFCGNEIDLPSGNICSICADKFRENGTKYGRKNIYWKRDNNLIFGGNHYE